MQAAVLIRIIPAAGKSKDQSEAKYISGNMGDIDGRREFQMAGVNGASHCLNRKEKLIFIDIN